MSIRGSGKRTKPSKFLSSNPIFQEKISPETFDEIRRELEAKDNLEMMKVKK